MEKWRPVDEGTLRMCSVLCKCENLIIPMFAIFDGSPCECELLKIALSFIGHVVVIWSEYCDTGVGLSENLKKWPQMGGVLPHWASSTS